MKQFSLLIGLFVCSIGAVAQSDITGLVTDFASGAELPFANVILDGTDFLSQSSFDGRYNLSGIPDGSYTLRCTSVGYNDFTKQVTIAGQDIVVDIVMTSGIIESDVAEIVAKVSRDRTAAMDKVKSKEAVALDFISRQQIQSTGDGNATDAFKRVPGVSTVGDFIFVRGLSDRYLKTNLNGVSIPSLDPRRNTVEMDIFPTNLVDNLLVVKTASPELPADWSGAFISVETRDYPDQFTFSFSATAGYNTQSTFREILGTDRDPGETFTFGKESREMPQEAEDLASEGNWIFPDESSGNYDMLVFMAEMAGIENYEDTLASIGVLTSTGFIPELYIDDLAFLQENGIESNADFSAWTQPFREEYVTSKNQGYTDLMSQFTNNWQNRPINAGPNMSYNLSFGDQRKLFGRTFGYIFGLQYKRSYTAYGAVPETSSLLDANVLDGLDLRDEDELVDEGYGVYARYAGGADLTADSLTLLTRYAESRGVEDIYWNALLNLSLELNPSNRITFMAMPNFGSSNTSRIMLGVNPKDHEDLQFNSFQRYNQRNMNIFQLKGTHSFPAGGKLSWITSYSKGSQITPGLKRFFTNVIPIENNQYVDENNGNDITADVLEAIDYLENEGVNTQALSNQELYDAIKEEFPEVCFDVNSVTVELDTVFDIQSAVYTDPSQFFRTLTDSIWDSKVVYEFPVNQAINKQNRLFIGGQVTGRMRQSREYSFLFTPEGFDYNGSLEATFDDSLYTVNGVDPFVEVSNATDRTNFYNTDQWVYAAFMGGDINFTERLRTVFGWRLELVDMVVGSTLLQDTTVNLSEDQRDALRGTLNETDVLPSLNIIYRLDKMTDPIKSTNLRLSFSQSIARPQFREKSPIRTFDFETLETIRANNALEQTSIDNYDLRLEHFAGFGQIYSVSLFYKKFRGAIERQIFTQANNLEITWDNVASSRVYGIEFEVRKKLDFITPKLDPLSLGLNVSWIKSETDIPIDELEQLRAGDPEHSATRPFFGQAPYIINALAIYQNDSIGLNVGAAFNVQGEKLVLVTKGLIPDIYEQPRPLLDLTVRKTIGADRRWAVQAKARNILNARVRNTYEFQDIKYDWTSFTTGTTYSIGVQYRIVTEDR